MPTYTILIILSGLVIFSYLFDIISSKTKIPSVLLLLFLGIGLRSTSDYFHSKPPDVLSILPALGTLGLILIVFEGALELKYEREKNKLIWRSFLSSLAVLIATSTVITFILHELTGEPMAICFTNSIPFSIVSSAIAISAAAGLDKQKKEYIIYESSFSDILGIVLFNFMVNNPSIEVSSFVQLGVDTALIVILSIISCLFLLYLIGRLSHHVKFFLIISILVLLYAVGELYHLSALILILSFGLFLNNADQIKIPLFKEYFLYPRLKKDLAQLLQLSAESAFILRTFFFIIFGFTMNIYELKNLAVLVFGGIILIAIYLIRYLSLKLIAKTDMMPELFIAPRGLISILLYYNLPENLRIKSMETGLLFLVILSTSVIMSIGFIIYGKRQAALQQG
ncbi:MAG: sodium:proton antiporter [Sphingobacteriaceae bacterium]